METVISLQHPAARFSHCTKAVLPSELGRGCSGQEGSGVPQPASPQAPAGRGDALCPTGSPIPSPAEDSALPSRHTGHLPILPAASHQPKSLFISSLESVPGCGWKN